ncbi:MAG: hypothetical protein CMJ67_01970 [Planctomycetaceae bacterium]|nr:hypothetical protein [Planctomycetaceae bacterium]
MPTTSIATIFTVTAFGIVASTMGTPPIEPSTSDSEEMAIRQGTWEMTRPKADSWEPRRFEVRTTTVVRDPDGTPVGDALHGRISMIPDQTGMKFAIERWGGNGSYARSVFDGTTITWFVPSTRDFERSFPGTPAESQATSESNDWTWLQSAEFANRFGPATSHLFEILYFDGFADFETIEGPNPVDLGPVQAIAFSGRPASWDQPTPEPDAVHVALSDHPLGFPLAVATRLPDGRTLEFEYHDWAIETAEQTVGAFDQPDPTRFDSNPPADWTEVMTIRIPGIKATQGDGDARFAGRLAAPTLIDANRATSFDAFDGDGPVAVLFHDEGDEFSMEQLVEATSGFKLDIHGVQVGGEPRGGTHWVSAEYLDRIWGFHRLPALVIVDGNRTVLEARSPWYGPASRPSPEQPVATVTETGPID